MHGDKRRAGILAHCHDIAGVILMAVGQRRVGDALDGPGRGIPAFSKVGFPVRNGSIRMRDLPVSMRKQEWPNQVICMACLVLRGPGGLDPGHKERTVS